MISRVKGTRDFLDLTLFNFIADQARAHFVRHNFTEIATPILEPMELFKRSLGAYTDVVSKEMFVIEPRGDDAEQICLRPEQTAPTIRAFIENGIQVTPWKVFTIGPMFRYERPQKGRYRQFNQINTEIVGTNSIAQDAQLIAMLDRFFHETLGINSYAILVNFLGCADDRTAYRTKLETFLKDNSAAQDLCGTCKARIETNIMRVFDCKSPKCQEILQRAPHITDNLCTPCTNEWQELQDVLPQLSVSFSFAPNLVRGLDYYNKTVFEFVSGDLGAQNAFCGGGRYELASLLGAREQLPSLGVGIGVERLMLLLEPLLNTLPLPQRPKLLAVLPLSPAQNVLAMLIADTLHAAGLAVDPLLDGGSVKSMMRSANRMGATYALIIGDEEQREGFITVKSMVDGAQEKVTQANLLAYFQK